MKPLPLLCLFCLCSLLVPVAFAKDEWPPIVKQELEMKDYAASPGVAAVILRREDLTDDTTYAEEHYFRIKILNEQGKKYGDVETEPFVGDWFHVENIKARTIEPDGTIVPFTGKPFDKVVLKSRGIKLWQKTWSMPDVRPGSIIEYRYTLRWESQPALHFILGTHWLVQQDLPMQSAHFTFRPAQNLNCAWIISGLSKDVQPVKQKDLIVLDVQNVPAIEREEFMPPDNEVRARVTFFYSAGPILTGDEYWTKAGKTWRESVENYMNKSGAMQREVASVVAAGDSPEQKLRKIYAHVQKIKNLTYQRVDQATFDKLKDNENVEDVLKHGWGRHNALNRLFTSMARAAGVEASLVRVAERDDGFFHKAIPNIEQLDSEIVQVKLDGQPLYLDPGTLYCPFGMLPWADTGVAGLIEERNGTTTFLETPSYKAAAARRLRTADLKLERDGTLSGTLKLTFEGAEALEWRLAYRESDDKERQKVMEDEVKQWLPSNAVVTLKSVSNWQASDPTLVADFDVSVGGFGTPAGRRLLIPGSIFRERPRFTFAKRTNSIYFHHAYADADDVLLTIPERLQIESLPAPKNADNGNVVRYNTKSEQKGNVIHLTREVDVEGVLFPVKYYGALKQFYSNVKAGDEEPAVLRVAGQ